MTSLARIQVSPYAVWRLFVQTILTSDITSRHADNYGLAARLQRKSER